MARRKGLPAIRQRKDKNGKKIDLWECLINNGRDPGTGKPKRIPVYGKTQEECRQKVIETLNSIQNQTFIEPNKTTLAQWMETWLQEYKKISVRPTTFSSYEWITKKHITPVLGQAYLKDLQPQTIQKFYNDKFRGGLSARTVRYIHILLSECLNQAVKNNLLARNVTDVAVLPKQPKKEIKVLSPIEQKRLIAVLVEERLGMAFNLSMFTGMRMGEVLGLQWNDIDFEEGILSVCRSMSRVYHSNVKDGVKSELLSQAPKTEKGKRIIPLIENILSALKEYKKAEIERFKLLEWDDITIKQYLKTGLVFCNELGKPIEPRNFIRKFHSLLKKAGLPKTNVHSLRHLFATRGLESGIDLKTMQELLGHANISITGDIYSHVSYEVKREAVNRLNNLFAAKN